MALTYAHRPARRRATCEARVATRRDRSPRGCGFDPRARRRSPIDVRGASPDQRRRRRRRASRPRAARREGDARRSRGRIVHAGHGTPAPSRRSCPASDRARRRDSTLAARRRVPAAHDRRRAARRATCCRPRTPKASVRTGRTGISSTGRSTRRDRRCCCSRPRQASTGSRLLLGAHRSPAQPDGFAGDADHWHRHFGSCFDTRGRCRRENVRRRALRRHVVERQRPLDAARVDRARRTERAAGRSRR